MKTRSGFVSNSSSSSFVLIVPVEIHEKALSDVSPQVRDMVNRVTKQETVFGRECRIYHESADAAGFSTVWGEYELWEDDEQPEGFEGFEGEHDAFYSLYVGKLPQDGIFRTERYIG